MKAVNLAIITSVLPTIAAKTAFLDPDAAIFKLVEGEELGVKEEYCSEILSIGEPV